MTVRDLLFRYADLLLVVSGVLFGLVLGAERRMRFRAERDEAVRERDQLAAGMVVALEGGKFRPIPMQNRNAK